MIKVKLCAFSDEADPSLEGQIAALKRNNIPYMEMRGVNGKNVTEYFKKVMALYAVAEPYRVWVDDDLRARNHKPVEYGCFCDDCLAKFNEKYGYSFTREELVKAINRTDIAVRRKAVQKTGFLFGCRIHLPATLLCT